jgi:hypothetical protein
MKVKFVVINDCYGGFPHEGVNREYKSPKAFKKAMKRLINLTKDEVLREFGGWHPLTSSNPVLYKIKLAKDEYYSIDEYDGMESLHIYKKGSIKSTVKKIETNFNFEEDI